SRSLPGCRPTCRQISLSLCSWSCCSRVFVLSRPTKKRVGVPTRFLCPVDTVSDRQRNNPRIVRCGVIVVVVRMKPIRTDCECIVCFIPNKLLAIVTRSLKTVNAVEDGRPASGGEARVRPPVL